MWKYLRALFRSFTGMFSTQYDKLQMNEHVVTATYDAAISKGKTRQQLVTDSVAKAMTNNNTMIAQIKELNLTAEKHLKLKNGSQAMMQKRIDYFKAQGKVGADLEAVVKVDPEFIKAQGWFRDASSSLDQTNKEIAEKQQIVEKEQAEIAKYKLELQEMQKRNQKLSQEKDKVQADNAIAKERIQLQNTLSGIEQDTTDADLAAVRKAHANLASRAQVATELNGNDLAKAEAEYMALASNSAADKELDGLLNWGEPAQETQLKDAKIVE